MLYLFAGIVSVLVLVADQISKWYILNNFAEHTTHSFINGIIDITHTKNGGAAWGILEGYTWVLLSLTFFIMIICVAMIIKEGFKSKLLFFSVCLILSGGIGNMIDRIFRGGYVVDFIHLHFMPEFPIFNIADCAVCIGAGMLILYFVIGMINDYKLRRKHETIFASSGDSTEPNGNDE